MRIRLVYSKRYGACFVPHIALAQIFSRSASRAGFTLMMTQGFSPRAKLSFSPELPAGVAALNEAVDMYFAGEPVNVITAMNSALPEGFCVSRAIVIPDDAPSLGKSCKHAEYLLRSTSGLVLAGLAGEFFGDAVVLNERADDWQRVIISDPAQNPIGGFVKSLVRENVIAGWHEMNIVRVSIGIYSAEKGCVMMNE
ncbi:MAG: DUF2344 domain-containing protein [Synergistaceae bacterium]|nr:DUF2344 domain-containing protein [Synergistaceae bacterium]